MFARSVAIVGRPNVGKSRLFNRIVGKRISIVHDRPGVTRDVVVADAPGGYVLMDTGGIGMTPAMTPVAIQDATEQQADFAIRAADLLLFVVDGREGMLPLDQTLAEKFRGMGKKPVLVVNKLDLPAEQEIPSEFARLGFSPVFGVSAEHGHGMGDLLEGVENLLPPAPKLPAEPEERRVGIAFVGRPNVGKSSLCNRLLDAERLIVSDVPGTTRETVELDLDYPAPMPGDAEAEHAGSGAEPSADTDSEPELPETKAESWRFRLFDTAGLKRRKRVDSSLDYFSSLRTEQAIERTDVVFLVLDAREGVTKQDKTLAGRIVEASKGLAVLVNKWDVVLDGFRRDPLPGYEDEDAFRKAYEKSLRKELFHLPDSPVLFVSARTGYSVEDFLAAARDLDARMETALPTSPLNRFLGDLFEKRPPAMVKGKRFKLFYAVQVGVRPVRIKLFCNQGQRLEDPYRRYLEKGITTHFGLAGCPLKFILSGKEERYKE